MAIDGEKIDNVFYHITRSAFDREAVRQRLEEKDTYTAEEVDAILEQHRALFETHEELTKLVKEKFEGSVLGTSGVRKSGRFHVTRRCFYLSRTPEGAVAEAAFYLYSYNGKQVGSVTRNYTIISAAVGGTILDATEKFDVRDLVCTHHAVATDAEDWVASHKAAALEAPSARMRGINNVAVYLLEHVGEIKLFDNITLSYDQKNPKIVGRDCKAVNYGAVIMTLAE